MAAILVMAVLVPVGVWIAVRLENGLDNSDKAAAAGVTAGGDPDADADAVRNQPFGHGPSMPADPAGITDVATVVPGVTGRRHHIFTVAARRLRRRPALSGSAVRARHR
jgi:hypothetical protein